jgi:glucosamine--fructose-6-phosphate aminotransferase (isomerizing)
MCGIVALSTGGHAGAAVLRSLRTLEYRGYDSAGVAALRADGSIAVRRAVGPLRVLVDGLGADDPVLADAATAAIGHTRWATHGGVSTRNAHPLVDCAGAVAVVHNGVIDNADALRAELELGGHRFASDVDTEVVAHLIEAALAGGAEPLDAMNKATARLEGAWALAVLLRSGTLLIARNGSPLLVRGEPGNVVVASDAAATVGVAGPLRALGDGDIVEIGVRGSAGSPEPDGWRWLRADGSSEQRPAMSEQALASLHEFAARADADRGQDQMGTEIAEQPSVLERAIARWAPDVASGAMWRDLAMPIPTAVRFLACGSSFHASRAIARTLSTVSGLPTSVAIASEFDASLERPADLTVAISQSGETADLLRALERVDGRVVGITNSPWSSLARRSDAVLDCAAGPEFGVAATKSFSSQIVLGVLLALAIGRSMGRREDSARLLASLGEVPEQMRTDDAEARMQEVAARHVGATGWLFLGRGAGLPYAAEGALKLEEITYRWAQSYPAGELKHGPLALVESGTPAVLVHAGDPALLATSAAEIAARGGRLVHLGCAGAAGAGDEPPPPWGPLSSVMALQHLARALAQQLGRDVDRPRNLAKSVTVV